MRYRLLCCSDTHGGLPPTLDEADACCWLHAGDVSEGPDLVDDGSDPESDPLRAPVARWFSTRRTPVFVVKGNHDMADDFGAFADGRDLTGRVTWVADRLLVAGLGWAGERYYELPTESDLQPVCERLLRPVERVRSLKDVVVLLTHYPPRYPGMREMERDPANGGCWYDCVRQLVEDLRAAVVIQGHVHQWAQTSQTVGQAERRTLIVHPGPKGARAVMDSETGRSEIEWPSA